MNKEQAKKDAGRIQRDFQIKFMQMPDEWPRWPLLPLKRGPFSYEQEFGFMVEGEGLVVFRGALYQLFDKKLSIEDFSREEFASFEAIYDAGWRVD